MDPVKEVCVESFDEAIRAVEAGASRIELCENLAVGGTTPSYGTIRKCLEKLPVPFMVMIRPRGGNFIYSRDEFEIMQEDILQCKELGVYGVVCSFSQQKILSLTGNVQLLDLSKYQILFKVKDGYFTKILTTGN